MADSTWVVETGDGKRGRRFSARGLGLLSPQGHYSDPLRPWWAAFACEEGAFRPLMANILTGKNILVDNSRKLVFQRSFPYVYRAQALPDGMMAAVIYLPEYFDLDVPPPEDADAAKTTRFVLLPDAAWASRTSMTEREVRMAWACARSVSFNSTTHGDLKRAFKRAETDELPGGGAMTVEPDAFQVAQAVLLGAHLDHRLRTPLLPDVGFYLHLLRVMLVQRQAFQPSLADRGRGWFWSADARAGYPEPIIVQCETVALEESILQAITSYIPSA